MNSTRSFKSNSPEFSRIALGFWHSHNWGLSPGQLLDFIIQSVETGITTFDHADIYGNYECEELFGRAIAGKPSLRANMLLVSKCGIKLVSGKRREHRIKTYDTSKEHIIKSVENSLKTLQTDYLDMLLIHRPDPYMDADNTAEAFLTLREEGKVLYFGVSNFLPSHIELLQSRLDFSLVTNQVEISVMKMDAFNNGVLDQCQQLRIRPMAWSPLGGGGLFHSQDEQAERLRFTLGNIGLALGNFGIDQVALAWLLNHPSQIIPVIGTGNIERVRKAAEAEKIQLTREQWFSILAASTGTEVP